MNKILAVSSLVGLVSLAGCYSPYYHDRYYRPYGDGYYQGYYRDDRGYADRPNAYQRDYPNDTYYGDQYSR